MRPKVQQRSGSARKAPHKNRPQKRLRHLAQCTRGLETVLAQELRDLGGRDVAPVAGGALFVGEGDDLIASWRALGTFLRRCSGANAYILSGAPELTRHLGLRASQRWPIKIGPLDARWLHYEMR